MIEYYRQKTQVGVTRINHKYFINNCNKVCHALDDTRSDNFGTKTPKWLLLRMQS